MKDFTIADGLRYVFSGVIAFAYLYAFDAKLARDFAAAAGPIGFPMVAAVVGSVFYFIYRPLIYNHLLERLQTAYQRSHLNYRQFLMKEYGIDFPTASHLWIQIRDTHLKDSYASLRIQSAGIHMTYLASFLALPFALLSVAAGSSGKAGAFSLICAVAFVAGFLNDADYEETECNMLLVLDREKRDDIATKLGHPPRRPPDGTEPGAAADTPQAAPR